MINILVIDDDLDRFKEILEVASSVLGIRRDNIHYAQDIVNGKKLLTNFQFDVMVLDLNLPNRIEDAPKPDGGLEIIRTIRARAGIKLPYHILGITSNDEAFKLSESEFSNFFWRIIRHKPGERAWLTILEKSLEYVSRSKSSLMFSNDSEYQTDIAIITAKRDVELEAVRKLPAKWQKETIPDDPLIVYRGQFDYGQKQLSVVASACPLMGMPTTAVFATKLIHYFRPKYLVMCGISAGTKGKANFGDILVPDPCWDWGSGKYVGNKTKREFRPAQYQISLEPEVRNAVNSLEEDVAQLANIKAAWPGTKPPTELTIHSDAFASGASVLQDKVMYDRVKSQHKNFIGLDMEAYAVFTACKYARKKAPIPIVAKSVSDFGDIGKKNAYQPYAAYTSASFIYELFRNL